MTGYEIEFQKCDAVCGEPFSDTKRFFSKATESQLQVLDLGCGQGKDALVATGYGHPVLGVDVAPTGIKQMLKKAHVDGLNVEGKIDNICNFSASKEFDVVILDRVIHMLGSEKDKNKVLETAATSTIRGRHLLVVDTPKNIPVIEKCFDSPDAWENTLFK